MKFLGVERKQRQDRTREPFENGPREKKIENEKTKKTSKDFCVETLLIGEGKPLLPSFSSFPPLPIPDIIPPRKANRKEAKTKRKGKKKKK